MNVSFLLTVGHTLSPIDHAYGTYNRAILPCGISRHQGRANGEDVPVTWVQKREGVMNETPTRVQCCLNARFGSGIEPCRGLIHYTLVAAASARGIEQTVRSWQRVRYRSAKTRSPLRPLFHSQARCAGLCDKSW